MHSTNGVGQESDFRIRTGFSSYSMSDLKNVNTEVLNNVKEFLNVPVKQMDNFDPGINYQVQLLMPISLYDRVGIFYELASTGSRMSYSDYTGHYLFDQILVAHSIGMIFEHAIYKNATSEILLWARGAYVETSLTWKEELKISDQLTNDNMFMESETSTLSIGCGYTRKFNSAFVGVDFGYKLAIPSKIHQKGDNKAYLRDSHENAVTTDWSGWGLGLSIGIKI
ncbi:MAG TPA: hypothetical protein PLH27_11915 [bacterium]|nr:hypothetical protein [bacterium]